MTEDPRIIVAKTYIERGWKILLLSSDSARGGKVPPRNCERCDFRRGAQRHDMEACDCLLCHGFHMATGDVDRFRLMLAALPHGMPAIRTGQASNLLVIDAEAHGDGDGPTGVEIVQAWEQYSGLDVGLPYTLQARSVSGGLHLYYRLPPGVYVTSGRILPSVDVKAELGYVGAPGASNREWVNPDTPVVDLPQEIIDWLTRTKRRGHHGHGGGGQRPNGYDFEKFAAEGAPLGHRDYFINDAVFRLNKQRLTRGLSAADVEREMFQHWLRLEQDGDDFPWEWVKYKCDRAAHEVEPDQPSGGTSGYTSWLALLSATTAEADTAAGGGQGPPQPPRGPVFVNQPPTFEVDLTHTGNQHRFVNLFQEHLRFVPGLGWFVWQGNVWRHDELNDVLDMTQDVLLQLRREQAEASGNEDRAARIGRWYESSSGGDARVTMVKLAAADRRIKTSTEQLDADPWLLVVRNGTVDLRTGKLRTSQPTDFNTKVAAVTFDPHATCPRWLEHIKLVSQHTNGRVDRNWMAFVQRWMGYTLTGTVDAQKFFFGFGGGNNGKNVMIETLLELLGDYGIRGSSKLLMGSGQEHETVIADLAGVRMAFIDETPSGRINEARLKELTGSSKVRARKIAKDSFEFKMQAKLWIAGNHKPRVTDTSDGFWRRLDLVPFDAVIPEAQRVANYAQVLLEEAPGILNWCLEGLAGYLELGGLGAPERVRLAGQTYREDEDTLDQFIVDTFERDGERRWLPNKVIHGLFEAWCAGQGIKQVRSMISLGQDLERAGFTRDSKTKKVKWPWPRGTQVVRGWLCPPLREELPEVLRFERAGSE